MTNKYDFTTMADDSLKEVYHGLNRILGIFSGHYQSMVFNPSADVYFVGGAIEKFKEIIKEASDEIERREPKPLMPPLEIHY